MTSKAIVALRVKASRERAFDVFTREIGLWWRPNDLFRFTPGPPGRMAFEPWLDGRLTETDPQGRAFEIGRDQGFESVQLADLRHPGDRVVAAPDVVQGVDQQSFGDQRTAVATPTPNRAEILTTPNSTDKPLPEKSSGWSSRPSLPCLALTPSVESSICHLSHLRTAPLSKSEPRSRAPRGSSRKA